MENNIKPEELRIGNLVNLKGKPVKINANHLLSMCNNGSENYSPLPLDEDILIKCGFHEKYKSCSNRWTKHYQNRAGYMELNDCEDETTGNLTGVFWFEWNLEVKYVHQLQNLYYFLSGGEELEIQL